MNTSEPKPPPKSAAREARDQRLARALRDNLRRRKGGKSPDPPSDAED